MLKSYCFAAAILAAAAMPAFADDCGSPPIAPAIPGASDLSGKPVEAGRAVVLDATFIDPGLRARVEALDGRLAVRSPAGGGTLVEASIPCG